ncbi:MAG: helicase associated domain-containing protein [bacterium]
MPRKKGAEVVRETVQERNDRLWLSKYNLFLEYIEEFGHQKIPLDENGIDYKPKYYKLSSWVSRQRNFYHKGTLLDWKYDMLVKADFEFKPLETQWDNKFKELLEFKEIYGHCNVSKYDKKYGDLGSWVAYHRLYKRIIVDERIQRLDDIGINWGRKLDDWDYMYNLLKEYYIKHGVSYIIKDLKKPKSKGKIKPLNRWIGKQILSYNKGLLPLDRIQLLEELDFPFEHKEYSYKDLWDINIAKLVRYKRRHGDYNVPLNWELDKTFSRWVHRQRKNKDKLPKKRLNSLIAIGFFKVVYDDIWEHYFQEFLKFKEANGHYNVGLYDNNKLYHWVRLQRKARRGNTNYDLPEYQIKRLDEIGFDWDPQQKYWILCHKKLGEFKKANGHCNVELTDKTKALYIWCQSNRENKDKLPEDKIQMLDEIGFVW